MKIICFLLWIATIIIGQIIGADQEDPATAYLALYALLSARPHGQSKEF